ncbi:MAG: hypothetical protein HXY25_08340 [Alphaproteobacteria bacterium]|nr:hypothetical protein [Alphaproteobacteria bacterium]
MRRWQRRAHLLLWGLLTPLVLGLLSAALLLRSPAPIEPAGALVEERAP